MKKTLFVLMVLCLTFQGHTQETETTKLVKLLHQTDMDFRLEMIQQFQIAELSETKKDSLALAKTLFTKIEAVYQKHFTAEELKELYAFYRSPLGAKLLEQQTQLHSEVSTAAYNWELEQQGMSLEGVELSEADVAAVEIGTFEAVADSVSKNTVAVKMEKITMPKIETLDDLKSLLRKDPFIISDQNILLALFGKETLDTLMEQQFEELETLQIEPEKKETLNNN